MHGIPGTFTYLYKSHLLQDSIKQIPQDFKNRKTAAHQRLDIAVHSFITHSKEMFLNSKKYIKHFLKAPPNPHLKELSSFFTSSLFLILDLSQGSPSPGTFSQAILSEIYFFCLPLSL